MKNIAGLFPGQGSQAVGMGQDFFEKSSVAKEIFASADKILGYPLSKLCFQGPIEELTLTQNAQPAILTVSYVAFLLAEIPVIAGAGHSLGEYSALVAAGALAFEDAVLLVHKRGRYMQEAVKPGDGKMVAVMGPTEPEIREVITAITSGVAEIANLNSPGQTVVAGDVLGIDTFAKLIAEKGGKVIPLNVSAPFHCRLMQPAAEKLAKDLDTTTFSALKFPVYANFSAQKITSGDDARALLKQQVCGSVRWTDSMLNMVREQSITDVVEFGAGGVLSKLMKRIDAAPARHEAGDIASVESLKQLK